MEALSTLGAESVSLVEIPGGQGTCCFGCQMAIPRASKNADLAVQFIKEALYGEYCQTNAFTTYGKMSVIKTYFDKALEQTPLWNNIADSMNKAVNIPEWEEQAKWLKGLNVIFQEGLVNPKLTGSDIVDQMVALSNSLKK